MKHKIRYFRLILGSSALLLFCLQVLPCLAGNNRPTIIVPQKAKVQGDQITLGAIAKIYPSSEDDNELLIKLRAIVLAESPPPSTTITILGETLLSTVESSGISRNSIGYSIPKIVTVEREGRAVTRDEVYLAVRNALSANTALDVQVREIQWSGDYVIPVGKTDLKATILGHPMSGNLPVQVEVFVDEKTAARFSASAVVDDWREVPVLNRTLDRGMLIDPADLQLVRLNLNKQPADVVARMDDAVGRRAKSQLAAGETIRKSLIDIPPTIPRGKKVTIVYAIKSLTATATGIAMDDGFENSVIRVQNESSRRVVEATVVNSMEVRVQTR